MRPHSASSASPLSPLQLLLSAYDQAISACRSRNASRAYRSIALLQEAHPCDSPSAGGIVGIYDWCERAVLSGDYLGAARALEQLRTAWETADRITSVPAAATSANARTSAADTPRLMRAQLD
jgi:hypothetical protein